MPNLSALKIEDLDDSTKLNVIIQALIEQSDTFQSILEQQAEIIEKLTNLDLPGRGFQIEQYDS